MDDDDLIFLGAVILLSGKGHDPNLTEIRNAVANAHSIYAEVKKGREEISRNAPLGFVEHLKRDSGQF